MTENLKFKEYLENLISDIFRYKPAIAAYMGKEEYEKEVAVATPEEYLEFVQVITNSLNQLKQFEPVKLNPNNQLLVQTVQDTLAIFLFLHEVFPLWNRIPLGLDEIQQTIFVLLQRNGPNEAVAEVVIAQLEQLPKFLEEFQMRFDGPPIPEVWKNMSYEMIQSTPQFYDYLVMIFKSRINENLSVNLSDAIQQAKIAVNLHSTWIKNLPVETDKFAWALGSEEFDKLLALRKLPWNRERILQTGYNLLDSLTEQAQQIAQEIDSKKTLDEVLEENNSYYPPTFEMVLEHARGEAERAKEFIKLHDLATIPEKDLLVITETPAYLAPLIPIAMYGPSPFYNRDQPGIYYITRPQDEDGLKKLGFHSYYSLPNVMVHEAYPGHHLDFLWNNYTGSPFSLISFFLSSLGAETVEGWAHYCEEMMLEKGFHDELGKQKVKLTITMGQIWRAVRIIVDIEMHCKQRTIEEAISLLVEKARVDENMAKAEVRRYTTAPGYQLSYLIGKLLIQDLRQEVEKVQGEKFQLKAFHDTILKSNDLPYYLLKKLFY